VEGQIQFLGYTDQDDKLQTMLTLKKRENVEIGLDQVTGLILAFFTGNMSSLTEARIQVVPGRQHNFQGGSC